MSDSRPPSPETRLNRLKRVPKRTWKIVAGILAGVSLLIGVVLGIHQLVVLLLNALGPPIRVDYPRQSFQLPQIEGVVIKDFDRNRDPDYYLQNEGRLANSYPSVYFQVVGQAGAEFVRVAPYVAVEVTDIKPMPERVDYAAIRYPGGGVAAANRIFATTFAPNRPGVFYAPQATADAVPGTSEAPYVKKPADYFTLASGELEMFHLEIFMVPGYFYRFRVGVPYAYRGKESVFWSEKEYVAGIPTEAEVWLADWSISKQQIQPFKRVGDLNDYQEAQEKRPGGYIPPPKYTKSQAAEAIERQNREVREYAYPYTPPQEFDKAGE